MKTSAYYVRVSTGRQEQEETIESQVADILERINKDGNLIPDYLRFADDGYTSELLARPALDLLRDAATRGEFQILYIWDADRIARSVTYQSIIFDELEELGIEIVDLHSSPVKTPEDKVFRQMKGVFSEYERLKIADRMRRGKMFKAKSGKVVLGPGPYGYRYILKTKDAVGYLEVIDEEAGVVRMIFGWVADEGLTIRQVMLRLYEMSICPRKKKRPSWTSGPLCRLLRNTIYIGQAFYNKGRAVEAQNPRSKSKYRKVKRTSRKLRPREEWIPIPAPPIIDEGLFYRAQKQLDINSSLNRRHKKHDYLLSGMVFCECESRMGCEGGNGNYYYRCQDRIRRYPLPRKCFALGINVERIDEGVWKAIRGLLMSPQAILSQLEKFKAKTGDSFSSNIDLEIGKVKEGLAKIEREEKRHAEAFGEGITPLELYKKLMEDIGKRKISLEGQLSSLLKERDGSGRIPQVNPEDIVGRVHSYFENITGEKKEMDTFKTINRGLGEF
jgi:site-specific DNA recombinase